MSRRACFLGILFLALVAWLTLACGNASRRVQSVTVSPSSADAKDYAPAAKSRSWPPASTIWRQSQSVPCKPVGAQPRSRMA